MRDSEKILFQDRAFSRINMVVACLCFAWSGLATIGAFTGGTRSVDALIAFAAFIIIGGAFLLSSFFKLIVTDHRLLIRQGLRSTEYIYSTISEAMLIETPNFPWRGPVRITIPRKSGDVHSSAAWETALPMRWREASQAILLLNKGGRTNYVLPHPKAKYIVSIIQQRLP